MVTDNLHLFDLQYSSIISAVISNHRPYFYIPQIAEFVYGMLLMGVWCIH
jgi:hypothetical protein